MDTFKDRLLSFFDKDAKPSHIASEIGMSLPGFMRVYNDGFIPKADGLIKIQEVTGCNLNWLLMGIGERLPPSKAQFKESTTQTRVVAAPAFDVLGNQVDVDEFVFIPRYDVKAAAGHGRFNQSEKPLYTMAFRRDWVVNYLDSKPENLFVIGVVGDSMEGVLSDHDTILVNESLTRPDNGLFIVRINESIIVKHLQVLPERKLLVKSANDAYEPFTIDLTNEYLDMQILGKVVWFGRLVK